MWLIWIILVGLQIRVQAVIVTNTLLERTATQVLSKLSAEKIRRDLREIEDSTERVRSSLEHVDQRNYSSFGTDDREIRLIIVYKYIEARSITPEMHFNTIVEANMAIRTLALHLMIDRIKAKHDDETHLAIVGALEDSLLSIEGKNRVIKHQYLPLLNMEVIVAMPKEAYHVMRMFKTCPYVLDVQLDVEVNETTDDEQLVHTQYRESACSGFLDCGVGIEQTSNDHVNALIEALYVSGAPPLLPFSFDNTAAEYKFRLGLLRMAKSCSPIGVQIRMLLCRYATEYRFYDTDKHEVQAVIIELARILVSKNNGSLDLQAPLDQRENLAHLVRALINEFSQNGDIIASAIPEDEENSAALGIQSIKRSEDSKHWVQGREISSAFRNHPVNNFEGKNKQRNYRIPVNRGDEHRDEQWYISPSGAHGVTRDFDLQNSGMPIVAVIDSGIDYAHEDLQINLWRNEGETDCFDGIDNDDNGYIDDCNGWNFVADNNIPWDDNGHGTGVTSLIAGMQHDRAGVMGLCWNCKIMVLKALNSRVRGTVSFFIKSIEYAVNNGAKISNNSYGGAGEGFQIIGRAVDRARKAGHTFVTASGNDSINLDQKKNLYPAVLHDQGVITVTGTDRDLKLAPFSNFGRSTVHIAAPAVDLRVAQLGSGYRNAAGTSFAAPIVTAAVALMLLANPDCTVPEVRSILLATSSRRIALLSKTVSGGIINVDAAVTRSLEVLQASLSGENRCVDDKTCLDIAACQPSFNIRTGYNDCMCPKHSVPVTESTCRISGACKIVGTCHVGENCSKLAQDVSCSCLNSNTSGQALTDDLRRILCMQEFSKFLASQRGEQFLI